MKLKPVIQGNELLISGQTGKSKNQKITFLNELSKGLKKKKKNFQVFTIPPMSSRSILAGALRISCSEEGMTVQARLCRSKDFEDIADKLHENNGVLFMRLNF